MKLKDLLENTPTVSASDQPDLQTTTTDDINHAIATLAAIGRKVKNLPGADVLDGAIRRLMGSYRRESQSRQEAHKPGELGVFALFHCYITVFLIVSVR